MSITSIEQFIIVILWSDDDFNNDDSTNGKQKEEEYQSCIWIMECKEFFVIIEDTRGRHFSDISPQNSSKRLYNIYVEFCVMSTQINTQ